MKQFIPMLETIQLTQRLRIIFLSAVSSYGFLFLRKYIYIYLYMYKSRADDSDSVIGLFIWRCWISSFRAGQLQPVDSGFLLCNPLRF